MTTCGLWLSSCVHILLAGGYVKSLLIIFV